MVKCFFFVNLQVNSRYREEITLDLHFNTRYRVDESVENTLDGDLGYLGKINIEGFI